MASVDELKLYRSLLATQHYTMKVVAALVQDSNGDADRKAELVKQLDKALDNFERGLSAMDSILGIDSSKDANG